ncbi:hypothetical protein N7478_000211 [Penicillium angulare]|uniref:uncharacterized protein n=1 Tax=Penicillium angulare TaxID=116970 RepID=UPI00254231DD|nr:uncharacterized protein N7478_000211 [Penicillium angulare]KAJ5290960.1 hypothetical protein N7478_000211 [Penicillium angulare]
MPGSIHESLESLPRPESLIAAVTSSQDLSPSVSFYAIDQSIPSPQCFPELPHDTYIGGPSSSAASALDSKKLRKKLNGSAKAIEQLLGVLSSNENGAKKINSGCQGVFFSKTPIPGPGGYIARIYGGLPTERSWGRISEQYLSYKGIDLKSTHQVDSISINTGVCLFSLPTLGPISEHFRVAQDTPLNVPDLPINERPTLYELEGVSRLASAIADIVCLIQERPCPADVEINIDVPDFQYYWSIYDFYHAGLIDTNFVRQWIDLVDERHSQMGSIMIAAIKALIRSEMPGLDIDKLRINITSGSETASSLIKNCLAYGISPSVNEVIFSLRSCPTHGELWQEFFANLDPDEAMETVADISRLIYVFKAVLPALRRRQRSDKTHMILQVDDIGEHRIFDRAEAFLKTYNGAGSPSPVDQRSVIIGLFPLHRISMAHLAHGKALYVHAPLDRLFIDRATGESMTIMRMISLTYGSRIAKTVQQAFAQNCMYAE